MADDKTLDVGIQAAGEAQNDDQQNHTVDDQTPVTQETQCFRQDLHDDTTEDGADNGAEAADDGSPQDNAGSVGYEGIGADVLDHHGVQAAGDAAVDSAKNERLDFVSGDVDAGQLGRFVIFADGDKSAAGAGADDDALIGQTQQHKQEDEEVVFLQCVKGKAEDDGALDTQHTGGAVGDGGPVDHYNTDHFAEAHGQQGQVGTFDFQSGDGQHHAEERGNDHRTQQAGDKLQPGAGVHQRGGVSADAEECGLAQGQLAGVASQHVDANAQDDIDTDHVNDLHDVHVWGDDRQQDQNRCDHQNFQESSAFLGSRHDKALLTVCFRSSCSAGRWA